MKKSRKTLWVVLAFSIFIACLAFYFIIFPALNKYGNLSPSKESMTTMTKDSTQNKDTPSTSPDTAVTNPVGTDELPEEETISFQPHCVDSTDPAKYMKLTQINVNGKTLSNISKYKSKSEISFGMGKNYTNVEGIVTFRGNNFRDEPVYGLANMKHNRLKQMWTYQTGRMNSHGKLWTGSGWTGQPLVVKWPRETKQIMNMYSFAKEKDDLVEVIYACLDGNIYFLDLKTGKQTRDTLTIGYTFKGAGTLDPRGYPIMYVGAGYNSNQGTAKVFAISLIDGSILYTFGDKDPFSLRGSLSFFDSSALIDAETDTLIYPGENGILYLIRLGTKYDAAAGTLSIHPKRVVKWNYMGLRSSTSKYWLGMEDSAVIFKGYLYIQDNGGHFMCLNLNTLQLVWVQDCLDDSNGSPVLSIEDGRAYLYASTSFHLGWRSNKTATIPIWKIDAETGEIVWQTDYECQSVHDVSGGVQSTIAIGKEKLSDRIYVTVSRTDGIYNGVLACLSKTDGQKLWEHKSAYTWSSPVCVYNEEGDGHVLYANSAGKLYLLDGETGEKKDELAISTGCIEASPVVYDNRLVIGTRGCQICGVKLR